MGDERNQLFTERGELILPTREKCKYTREIRYIKIQPKTRPQNEALGNSYRVCEVYSPYPRAEVYCVRLNFNISQLVYLSYYFLERGNEYREKTKKTLSSGVCSDEY